MSLHAVALVCLPFLVACTAGQVGTESDDTESADDAALRQCAPGATLKGIDVSYYQGVVDWDSVAASGRSFAFVRLGDGFFHDPKFDINWPATLEAGLYRGMYQYFRAGQDPIEQAQAVIAAVGTRGPMDLPPTIDVETLDGERASTVVHNVQIWIDTVTAAIGRAPMVYISQGFADQLSEPAAFAASPLWVANWTSGCPRMPSAWTGWKFWQNRVGSGVTGVHGKVDQDVFNGTVDELAAFAGPGI